MKQGAVPGDRLLLTKPLGTGVVLAAAMQGLAGSVSLTAAQTSMDRSNAPAVEIFTSCEVHALTDVTGFGLAGHLGEMLRASGVGVVVDLGCVPLLSGVERLLGQLQSSLQQANELALADYQLRGALLPDDVRLRALADPQTAGGLLAAVPAEHAASCLQRLQAAGFEAAEIGRIVDTGWVIQ